MKMDYFEIGHNHCISSCEQAHDHCKAEGAEAERCMELVEDCHRECNIDFGAYLE